ncbi:MAG: bifunctional (p)ppGpp synthetase/guanosine-3',5'-bis(diphosphate) 3'-pyrophosphohydrolase [Candidatus Colwellbacteria bacterium]|nr:bifunctional (p)ppGpp synthetase/guanosine-3',5'-bis(diphosphate) 3'-pyrophosphohydrolase [Candidatus Colwellbacteria bacterium]
MNIEKQILELFVDAAGRALVAKVIAFARERHGDQPREGGELHVEHVLRVGLACGQYAQTDCPEDLLTLVLAGICHDLKEDTGTTLAEISELCGAEVARIVHALSHEYEEESDVVYLARVATAGRLAVVVKRHDKLDNLRSLASASANFRERKIAETRAALVIWAKMDPDAVPLFEEALYELPRSSPL